MLRRIFTVLLGLALVAIGLSLGVYGVWWIITVADDTVGYGAAGVMLMVAFGSFVAGLLFVFDVE